MHQQVNLYRPELRPRRTPFSAGFLALACALSLAVMAAITGYSHWQHGLHKAELANLGEQTRQWRARGDGLREMLARINADDRLDKELEESRRRLAAMRQVLDHLDRIQRRPAHDFSDYLGALARRPVDGLWLTRIGIQGSQRELEISGTAIEPALLPRFIDHIGQEAPYRGREFRNLRISRSEPAASVDFRLSTREAESR